jgi:MFS family permease
MFADWRVHHVKRLFATEGFRRLVGVRLVSQFGDGVFQASLAGAVLFNPEQQAKAADVAAGFAVLLLPYSIIGPFAGVLLDRWWRQRILVLSGPIRALAAVVVAVAVFGGVHGVPLYVLALVSLALARFVLAALSAAQPHVVATGELASANAFSTTAGTVATTLGGGAALLLRLGVGESDHGYGIIGFCAPVFYLAAGLVAVGMSRTSLGPDDAERAARETLREAAHELAAAGRHIRGKPEVFDFLVAIGLVRLCHGITIVSTVLLYRNYFADSGVFRAGLSGLLVIVIATAIGGTAAAVATPAATRRLGAHRWSVALIASSAFVQVLFFLPYRIWLVPFGFVLTSFSSQGVKICVDTTVQREVDDRYRGRVFAFYDAIFNLALVTAAVLVSVVLPDDGYAPAAVLVIAAVYLFTSGWFAYQRRSSSTAAS